MKTRTKRGSKLFAISLLVLMMSFLPGTAGIQMIHCEAKAVITVPAMSFSCDGKNSVKLEWEAVEGADSYQIERRRKTANGWGEWTVLAQKKKKTKYKDKTVKKGKTYQYRYTVTKGISKISSAAVKVTVKKPTALVLDPDYHNRADAGRVAGMLEDSGFVAVIKTNLKGVKVSSYDALVIPGGNSVTPSVYGAKKDSHTYGTKLAKDKVQINAVKKFIKAKKPILGICRGMQLINVTLGGTLTQHIGTKKGNTSGKYKGWHKGYRTVTIEKGSWLYDLFGKKESVYHSHHQCIKKLAEGLVVTQQDKNSGIIEAVEHETLPIYGLQWHPDNMGAKGRSVMRAFRTVCQSQ